MRPTVIVEAASLFDDSRGVLLGLAAMTMHALLFQLPDNAVDHAVLLRAMRRDELLPKSITAHEARIGPRALSDLSRNASERPEPRDQRLLGY